MDAIGGMHLCHLFDSRTHWNGWNRWCAKVYNHIEWNSLWQTAWEIVGHCTGFDRYEVAFVDSTNCFVDKHSFSSNFVIFQAHTVNGLKIIQPTFRMRYVCWWSDWTLAKRHKHHLGWKIYVVNVKSTWHRMLNHFYRRVCRPSAMDTLSTPMRFDWCTALANSWACCHMKMYCDGWMSLCHHALLNYNLLYKTNRYELKLLLTLQCYLNRFLNILNQLNDASKIRTTFRLNMISTLFSSLNTRVKSMEDDAAVQNPEAREQPVTQPVLLIMQKTMPIFKDIATLWINETSVIEVWSLILGENNS